MSISDNLNLHLPTACTCAWCAMSLASLLVYFIPALGCIAQHGKMIYTGFALKATPSPTPIPSSTLLQRLAGATVPKSYFTHMYALGLAALPFYMFSSNTTLHSATLACLAIHLLRRLGECLWVTSYGASRVHLGGYLAGLWHYLLLPLSISLALRDSHDFLDHSCNSRATLTLAPSLNPTLIIAVLLFAACSWLQHAVHANLAGLKATQILTPTAPIEAIPRYPLPRGILFALVCCPHYTAEVGIYTSLWLLRPSSPVLVALLGWVMVNLAVVAEQQLQWYRKTYPGSKGGEGGVGAGAEGAPMHWGGWVPCLCMQCRRSKLSFAVARGGGGGGSGSQDMISGGCGGGTKKAAIGLMGLSITCLLLLILMSSGSALQPRPRRPSMGTILGVLGADSKAGAWTAQVAGLSQGEIMHKDMCILVDTADTIIGQASKFDAHRFTSVNREGLLHRAFSVFLFDPQGRLLLQQRASDKITFPGVWTNTCCSHPLYGYFPSEVDDAAEIVAGRCPGIKAAAVRKLQHELGIAPSTVPAAGMRFITRLRYSAANCPPGAASGPEAVLEGPWEDTWGESEVDYILFLRADLPPQALCPNPEEVQATRFVSPAELRAMLADPALSWSPWFRIIVERFLWRWWGDLEGIEAGRYADANTIHAF